MSETARVLAADTLEGVATLEKVLEPVARVVPATSLRAALGLMPDVDMTICGIHFDSSRMFDLLRMAKADPQTRQEPILCYRDLDSALSSTMLESLRIACVALGAEGFVDLHELRLAHGTQEADQHLRRIVAGCLARRREA